MTTDLSTSVGALALRVAEEFNTLRASLGSALLSGDGPPAAAVASATHVSSADAYVESLDIPVPAGCVEGDVLVLIENNAGLEDVAVDAAFTLINQSQTGGDGIGEAGIWVHVVGDPATDPEPATYTITPTDAAILEASLVRCVGVNGTVRAHSTALQPDDTTPSPAPAALSGVQASDLVVVGYGYGDRSAHSDGGPTIAGPGGAWTDQVLVVTQHLDDWNSSLLVSSAPGSATLAAATPARGGSWVVQAVALEAAQADVGNDGDFYLDVTGEVLYGPKTSGVWGAGIPLGSAGGRPGDVTAFGAAGDGVTDDSAAFQAAFDAAGDQVWVPAGNYLIATGLTVGARWINSFTLDGEAQGQVTITYTGTGPCITLDPSATPSVDTRRNNWRISNLTFVGPGVDVAGSIGIWANNALQGRIDNVTVTAFETGVKFDGLGLVNDTACYFNTATNLFTSFCGTGVWYAGQANSNMMLGGQTNGNAIGVLIDSTTNNINLHGVDIESNTDVGVQCAGFGNQFLGCRHENSPAPEFIFDDSGGDLDGTQNIIVGYWSDSAVADIEGLTWDTNRANTIVAQGLMHIGPSKVIAGTGTPLGNVTGRVGDLFLRSDGAAGTTVYIKETGSDTTAGWAALVSSSRTLSAGTGLSGGGDLSANRTLAVTYGTAAGTAAQGNDSRLSDSRTPTGTAGGVLTGTYPNPGFSLAPFPPASLSSGSTVTASPSTAGTNSFNVTAGGSISSLGVSASGASDGQMVVIAVQANSNITVTPATGSIGAQSIGNGVVGFFGFRYHSGLGVFVCIAFQASS